MCDKTNKDYLIEYQKAQDSAQHHDMMIWRATAAGWAGNIALFALAVTMISLRLQPYVLLLCILGIVMTVSVLILSIQRIGVLKQKYDRCKAIEVSFGFEQHKNLKYRAGPQKISHTVAMLLFIGIWIWLFWAIRWGHV